MNSSITSGAYVQNEVREAQEAQRLAEAAKNEAVHNVQAIKSQSKVSSYHLWMPWLFARGPFPYGRQLLMLVKMPVGLHSPAGLT